MVTFSLFIISGTALVTLTLAKRREERRKTGVFLLKAISRGDERARALHHQAVRLYSEGKERADFLIKKQLPMRSRHTFNKLVTLLQEQSERYAGRMRDSKLLKKSDGISEFFKNMSEVEKGAGEINEAYEETILATAEPIKPTKKISKKMVRVVVKEE
ncbi:MAG: hypothetical protein Q7R67_02035 [bacterium]|nr:hypothetical protein [bacterium]